MSEQLLFNLDNLIGEAVQLASEHPNLVAMEGDGDNPLFETMKRAWSIDKGGWIHLTFCCLDCDGGYDWPLLLKDLRSSKQGIVRHIQNQSSNQKVKIE